jgi:hypothetical protein
MIKFKKKAESPRHSGERKNQIADDDRPVAQKQLEKTRHEYGDAKHKPGKIPGKKQMELPEKIESALQGITCQQQSCGKIQNNGEHAQSAHEFP